MWHNTAKSAVFGVGFLSVDATALFAFGLYGMYFSWTTFWLSVSALVWFWGIKYLGWTPAVFLRILRRRLAGPVKYSVLTKNLRKMARLT